MYPPEGSRPKACMISNACTTTCATTELLDSGVDKKLLSLKRKEQIQTAEQVWSVGDYAKQYKTIKFLMETIFPVRLMLQGSCVCGWATPPFSLPYHAHNLVVR